MNETIQTLMNRKSIRKFTNQSVPEDVKQIVLDAAMQAPSAGAMMLYSIIEVEDQTLKDTLAESCDHQPFIANAPWLLLFVADYQRWFDYYEVSNAPALCSEFGRVPRTPQEGDFLLACMDALIAAQNAVIAAESLGLGSCYIGDIVEHYEQIRELFHLPRYSAPIALLCFGYPTEDQKNRNPVKRFDKKYIVHKNHYPSFSEQDLLNMFPTEDIIPTNPLGRLAEGQRNYIRKFTADFSIEMSRSVREMLKNWQQKNPGS
jgi:FMN reductase (NADPH)/FMN reductase [NAD(P)H]